MDQEILAYLRGSRYTLGLKKGQLTLQTCKHPRLFYLLQKWAVCVPIRYTTIEIINNINPKPKKLKHDIWMITGGSFTDGLVETDDGQTHDLMHGKQFSKGECYSIKDWKGRRVQISFWDDGSEGGLTPYEAVFTAGEWKMKVTLPGQPTTYLPKHAAKKHKILAATTPPLEPMRGDLNAAQSLLLTALSRADNSEPF